MCRALGTQSQGVWGPLCSSGFLREPPEPSSCPFSSPLPLTRTGHRRAVGQPRSSVLRGAPSLSGLGISQSSFVLQPCPQNSSSFSTRYDLPYGTNLGCA